MRTLLNNGCALAYVNSVGEPLADKIPDYMGLEVSLPKLVCRNSFDLTLNYKRIGIASALNSKVAVYREIERPVTSRFKVFGKLTIICSDESLNSISDILDLAMKNEIDTEVCKVIKDILGENFKVTSNMYYFNVDISGMAFGANNTKGVGDDIDSIVYEYLHSRYMHLLLFDNWMYSKQFVGLNKYVCDMLNKNSKEVLEHLASLGVRLFDGTCGDAIKAHLGSSFSLSDKRDGYNFYPKIRGRLPRLVEYYSQEVSNGVITKDRITEMFTKIADKIASEVMNLVEPNDYGLGMSEECSGIMCDYNLDFAVAFGYARYIFNGGDNGLLFSEYMRETVEKYKDDANTSLLKFVDILHTSYRNNKLDIENKFDLTVDGDEIIAKFKSAGVLEPKNLVFTYSFK